MKRLSCILFLVLVAPLAGQTPTIDQLVASYKSAKEKTAAAQKAESDALGLVQAELKRIADLAAGLDSKPTPPKPPITQQKLHILIIEETADAVPQRGAYLTEPNLWARIKDKGHDFQVVDKDVKDRTGQVPVNLKGWIDKTKDKKLPWLFLIGPDGTEVFSGPLPKLPVDLVAQLAAHGG